VGEDWVKGMRSVAYPGHTLDLTLGFMSLVRRYSHGGTERGGGGNKRLSKGFFCVYSAILLEHCPHPRSQALGRRIGGRRLALSGNASPLIVRK